MLYEPDDTPATSDPRGPDAPGGYERHFGLLESPFTLTSNPRFLFESASHLAALREIAYSLPRREPVIVVTGAIGTGKTTLCRIIAARRGRRTFVATINTPPDSVDDLLRLILDGFHVLADDTSHVVQASHYGLLRTLNQFLASLVSLNAQAIVLFDEAQHLSPDMLEQIRLLSNIDVDSRKLLQIILVGQPELEDLLARDDLRQLAQRITRHHRLGPLEPQEVHAYVDRRIGVARDRSSVVPSPEFTTSAMRAIATLSGGVPRIVNTLCDRALEDAWSRQARTIDGATIVHAAAALGMPVPRALRFRSAPRTYQAAVAVVATAAIAAGAWSARDIVFRRGAQSVLVGMPGAAPPSRPEVAATTAPVAVSPDTPPHAASPLEPAPVAAGSSPTPDAQPAATTPTPAGRGFLILVSSFRTEERAEAVSRDLAALGLPVIRRTVNGWQQVVVGPYASRDDATAAQARLESAQISGTRIVASTVVTPSSGPASVPSRPSAVPASPLPDGAPIADLLQRASVLAVQPNVRALQQIRAEVARRQASATGSEAAELRAALDQIDQHLDAARRRQLENDSRRLGSDPAVVR